MSLPSNVTLYEVGPRDGLQNETGEIDTKTKIEFIDRLSQTGLKYIEATAFVSPKWVPQMADHADVMAGINKVPAVRYPVLVPNLQGLKAAIESGVQDIAVFGAASETFSQKNINAGIEESLKRFDDVVSRARKEKMRVRGYVSCVAGCPYEGDVPPANVSHVVNALSDMGCYEISLGDTTGVGTPNVIAAVLDEVTNTIPVHKLALHCHDTYGMAVANIYEALQHGIATIDASVGGLGGCPYAPGAAGNVATEDVLYLLKGLGIETGVDLDKMVETAKYISAVLGRDPNSKSARAILAKQ